LIDLLEYAQGLVTRGNANHNSHVVQLQSLIKEQPSEVKVEVKPKAEQNRSQIPSKNSNVNNYLLIGGLVLLVSSVLTIGYWLGKNKKHSKNKLYFDKN
jgi:hypothetical protein